MWPPSRMCRYVATRAELTLLAVGEDGPDHAVDLCAKPPAASIAIGEGGLTLPTLPQLAGISEVI